jgi:molybdopterin-guanine dinucleotide biosynthesis protein A
VKVSGIVLAGGASRRFGRDKLVEPIDGVTLLERAVLALAGVVDEVVVVIGPDGAAAQLRSVDRPVRYARDREPFGGPLVGLRTGLAETRGPIVVVAGGDMPWLVPGVLGLLVDRVPAALVDPAGMLRPLPCALDRAAALVAVDELLAGGDRRLRAVLARVGTVALPWADWQVLDPGGLTLVDIDEPGDLPGTSETPTLRSGSRGRRTRSHKGGGGPGEQR